MASPTVPKTGTVGGDHPGSPTSDTHTMLDFFYNALLIGIGATALLDLWAQLLRITLRIATPPWHFVGRWFAGMLQAGSSILKASINRLPSPANWPLAGPCIM